MGDPLFPLSKAQEIGIRAMEGSRTLDERHQTNFAGKETARERLRALGVDPDTLQVSKERTK